MIAQTSRAAHHRCGSLAVVLAGHTIDEHWRLGTTASQHCIAVEKEKTKKKEDEH
jgi:hypothetical protein